VAGSTSSSTPGGQAAIGYLPETPPVYTDMTVRAYLRFVAEIKGRGAEPTRERVERVAAKTKLRQVRPARDGNLSKGQRQRVGLAQALLMIRTC